MQLKDVGTLKLDQSSREPARLGRNVPEDLSKLKRGSVCLIVRKVNNEQEILLIKRTARPTDRWSGHIAFPGGRQDPGENDLQTAIRETQEEVGIDLNTAAELVGPLNPRLIRVSWGRRIAMVLCPFIFTINPGFEDVPLIPQESEVAHAFWYPLSSLFDASQKSYHPVSVRTRLDMSGILGEFVKSQAGDMLFDAVDISPKIPHAREAGMPWKMWGITWAIMQDLRQLIDSEYSSDSIRLPTFNSPDLRLIMAIISAPYTFSKRRFLRKTPGISDLTNRLLEGYFAYFPIVIGSGIALRVATTAAALCWIYKSLRTSRL